MTVDDEGGRDRCGSHTLEVISIGIFPLSTGLYNAVYPWVLVVGGLAYVGFGLRMWRKQRWPLRLSYVLGGAVLALYEVHMLWWIGAIGFALVGAPLWMAPTTTTPMTLAKGDDTDGFRG